MYLPRAGARGGQGVPRHQAPRFTLPKSMPSSLHIIDDIHHRYISWMPIIIFNDLFSYYFIYTLCRVMRIETAYAILLKKHKRADDDDNYYYYCNFI